MKHLCKTVLSVTLAAALASTLALAGCSSPGTNNETNSSPNSSSNPSSSSNSSPNPSSQSQATETQADDTTASALGTVSNTIADDEDTLVSTYASAFEQKTYEDSETGKSVTYNLFLPEGYDASKSYPMVVFIADSSCVGDDATRSLTQGLGGVVWASDEWQAANPSIVCVPSYPETVLDDHNGYTTTDYVELTKRLIDSVSSEYAVDTSRIYGTGQSMGCMTTLVLASEYPELYAACMFVDGQWDVNALKGLEGQKFVYFAAEDDTNAYAGMQEVMQMFDADGAAYTYKQWDGTWSADALSTAATELFDSGTDANFVSWKTGTIDASSAQMGGGSMGGGTSGKGMRGGNDGDNGDPFGGPSGDSSSGNGSSNGGGSGSVDGGNGGGAGSGMGSVGYHMASFDYAYRCIAVMEWLFQ